MLLVLTVDWQRGYTVYSDVTDGAAHGLAHIHEAVLDVALCEHVALKGHGVLPPRHALLGQVVEAGRRRRGAHICPEAAEHPHTVAALQDTRWVLEQHGHAAVSVAREDAPGVHVEHELVTPLRLQPQLFETLTLSTGWIQV